MMTRVVSHKPVALNLSVLADYTAWERERWHEWFLAHGVDPLKASSGPGGDGRFATVGELIRHVFSAEKRYIDRLSGREITDTRSIPTDDVEALFDFGGKSRAQLIEFIETISAEQLDVPFEFNLMNSQLKSTPKKIVLHVLIHEIRHWAQIATLLRFAGFRVEMHDFLFSPVLGSIRPD